MKELEMFCSNYDCDSCVEKSKPHKVYLKSDVEARDAKLKEKLKEIHELQKEVFTETMRIVGDDFGETQCADSLTELQDAVVEALLLLEGKKEEKT